jgi:type VI secretion system secreted protein Hcp
MAIDVFMKIDGISGESLDTQFKDWIEVLSLNWVVESPVSKDGAGQTVRSLRSSEFSITKVVDKATTQIVKALVQNENIKEIRVALCRSGKEKIKYLEYVFKNCVITKAALRTASHSEESLPTEDIQFRFALIEITYFQQKREGGGSAGQISFSWNISERI